MCAYVTSVVSDSLSPQGLYSPLGSSVHGGSPDKNTGMGCHALLQGIFPIQGSNPLLLLCRQSPALAGRFFILTSAPRGATRGREELPYVRGQGQKLGGPHARRVAAKRSHPTSEVRGSGPECLTATVQEWLRGVTQHPRSGGGAAGRSYPTPLSPRPGAAGGKSYPTPPCPRPGAAAGRRNPTPEARGGGR